MLALVIFASAGFLVGCRAVGSGAEQGMRDVADTNADAAEIDTGRPDSAPTVDTTDTSHGDSADTAESGRDSGETGVEVDGDWVMVSASQRFACGLRVDGTISCWGQNDDGQASPPSGTFVAVETLGSAGCGLRIDGEIQCWGNERAEELLDDVPVGPWESFWCGSGDCVAMDATGSLAWWGSGDFVKQTPPSGEFVSADAGQWPGEACAVSSTGQLTCWDPDGVEYEPVSGTFASVTLGSRIGCALDSAGTPACWCYNEGAESIGLQAPPAAAYATIDIANSHACGLTTSGEALCWGDSTYWWGSESTIPPAGTYQSVDAGVEFSCGVTTTRHAVCWGVDDYGQATPPV